MLWACSTCGMQHDDLCLSFAADFPDNYADRSEEAREDECAIGSDQCVIKEEEFYIRGCLEIPIHGQDEVFLWGLWASVSQETYEDISQSWEEPMREKLRGPYKGRLGNDLREYPGGTWNLKCTIRLRPVGQRPLFFADEVEHPLAIAQRQGIAKSEAAQLAERLLHKH